MRTSVRQWCLTLIAGYRYWISPFLGLACPSEPTCSEYARGPRSSIGGAAWTQACDLPSAALIPISSWRNGSCEVVGSQSFTSG